MNEYDKLVSEIWHKIARTGKSIRLISITSKYYERVAEGDFPILSPRSIPIQHVIDDSQKIDKIIL